MSRYKVMLQNSTTKQIGSVTISSWSEDYAKSEAKQRLERMGFTEVLSCKQEEAA